MLSERVPYRFVSRSDNRIHVVAEGDTLHTLAHDYFQGLPRPAQFYWVIADFQPEPILDPSIRLAVGRQIVIPSLRTLVEEIFNEGRRSEFTG